MIRSCEGMARCAKHGPGEVAYIHEHGRPPYPTYTYECRHCFMPRCQSPRAWLRMQPSQTMFGALLSAHPKDTYFLMSLL